MLIRGSVLAISIAMVLTTSSGVSAYTSQAAASSKPVTNADVVSMTAAKLSDEVIINAIRQSTTTAFDLTPDGLVALRTAGVSDLVMQAMQARAKGEKAIDGTKTGTAVVTTNSATTEGCGIFVTEEEPPARSYVVVRKEIQAGKKFYGGHDDNLMRELATQARKVGADAIIKFHEWRAPSMWSWAAAKAGGMAVKWTAQGKADASMLKGQCWAPK